MKLEETLLPQGSYHVFEHGGDYFLYDLGSKLIFDINEFTYVFFKLAGENTQDQVIFKLADQFPELGPQIFVDVMNSVNQMKEDGFFKDISLQTTLCALKGDECFKLNELNLALSQWEKVDCKYCGQIDEGEGGKNIIEVDWLTVKSSIDFIVNASQRRSDLTINFLQSAHVLDFEVLKRAVKYCRDGAGSSQNIRLYLVLDSFNLDDSEKNFLTDHQVEIRKVSALALGSNSKLTDRLRVQPDEMKRIKEYSALYASGGCPDPQGVIDLKAALLKVSKVISMHGAPCGDNNKSVSIDARGDIFPCFCYFGQANYSLGDVRSALPNILDSRSNAIENRLKSDCNECWVRNICDGVCVQGSLGGNQFYNSEHHCDSTRREYESLLWVHREARQSYPGVLASFEQG
ncbi:MAG: SPASM domain-containing protein [Planctomycetes bacterium]|nr:SPASM domain-containing protein [Planctomycetota bacterium]